MKRTFSLIAILFLVTQLNAQNSKSELGLELGPSRTFIIDSWAGYNEARLGYYVGLSYQYNISERFSIRTGLALEQKGFKQDRQLSFADSIGNFTYDQLRITETFNYVTVPLLLRVNFGKKIKYFINAGPYAGFMISHKYERKASTMFGAYSDNNIFGYNRIDMGISVGAGIQYPINSKVSSSLEVRHNEGLTSIYGRNSVFQSVRARASNILIGVSIGLGKQNFKEY